VRTVSAPSDVRASVAAARSRGRTIGFVPTMGALHAGHTSLIEEARAQGHYVVVSIFVNPMQFNDPRDLAAYPRTNAPDENLCSSAGVDLLWRPTVDDIYPTGFDTSVEPGLLASVLEGEHRPGHFRGVATVVLKLFNVVAPDVAFFGRKDFQQLAVIKRMVHDLAVPVDIVGCPTIRESDGLAMSSRNVKLSFAARQSAVALSRALHAVVEELRNGRNAVEARAIGVAALSIVGGVELEYLEVVDRDTLAPVAGDNPVNAVVVVAATVDGVRLIDNLEVDDIPQHHPGGRIR
jgi:pantoate--beta-alanine ligase